MIAVDCPQCGAATPAFPLAPEHVTCRACRYQGPPRPEVLAEIRAAAAHLGTANAYLARQVGRAQARAIGSLASVQTWLHIVVVLLLVPLGACGGLSCIAAAGADPDFSTALAFGLPLVCFVVGMAAALRRIDAQMRELTRACGAVPPPAPGEPAQCHLCGAGLPPATSANPLVRCRHCGADNVAGGRALKIAVNRKHWVIGHFNRNLAQRSAVMASSGAGLVVIVFLFGLVSPIIGCTGAIVLDRVLDTVPLEPLPFEYVVVDVGGEPCVATVDGPAPGGAGWVVRGSVELGGRPQQTLSPTIQRVPARWFVGRWTRAARASTSQRGFVRDVQRHLLKPRRNEVVLQGVDGTRSTGPLAGRCLLERPGGELPVWDLRYGPETTPVAATSASARRP